MMRERLQPKQQSVIASSAGPIMAVAIILLLAAWMAACSGSPSDPQVIVASGALPAATSAGLPTTGGASATSTSGNSPSGNPSSVTSSSGAPSLGAPSSGSSPTGGGSGSGGASAASDSGASAAAGVPCDVATMLGTNCNACHSNPPLTGALAGLVTYSDLMAPSHEVPSQNEAQLSLARMMN